MESEGGRGRGMERMRVENGRQCKKEIRARRGERQEGGARCEEIAEGKEGERQGKRRWSYIRSDMETEAETRERWKQ
eukprot:6191038-Pleurochrysis_carterae.AAC.1